MIRLKPVLGYVAAQVVRAAARTSGGVPRPLDERERTLLSQLFHQSVEFDRVRLCEGISGPLNVTGSAFVIRDTVYLPGSFLPLADAVLVHELVHVWQYQHGGHAYIADSVQAQLWGEGYALGPALARGASWQQLNCEQQATLIERGFAQGALEGQRLLLDGADATEVFHRALAHVRAGEGASFARS